MEESKRENKQESAQELLELGASTTKSSKGNIYTLTIIGQIEGHQTLPETVKTTKYEHVIPLLAAVEESDARHEDGVACHTDQHVGVGYKLYRSAVDEDVVVALAQAFKHLVEGVVFKQFCRVGADGARRQDVDSRAFVVHNQFVEVGARSVEI